MNKEKQYLTQQQLAKAFKVSRQRVTAWRLGGCPCYNVNHGAKRSYYRYSEQEVAEWLRSRAAEKEVQA